MVLVDPSIWIRFLANRNPTAAALDELLRRDRVAGHELVYGELMMGDSGARRGLLSAYGQIRYARTVPHREVVEFVRARRLSGRGAGWTDAYLLASAVAESLPLWTADARLAAMASELGVGYDPNQTGA